MTKAASKGPKASIQYVRTLAKRLDRIAARARDSRENVEDLWEFVYTILSTLDPEIVNAIPTQVRARFAKQTLLFPVSEEE